MNAAVQALLISMQEMLVNSMHGMRGLPFCEVFLTDWELHMSVSPMSSSEHGTSGSQQVRNAYGRGQELRT